MQKFMMSAIVVSIAAGSASAHDGRRLDVRVVNGTLIAQGYVSNGIDDGGGTVRPYANAIHGHWSNNPAPGVVAASADLPGFDVLTPGPLAGHAVYLHLHGARKWVNPPMMLEGVTPTLVPLGAGEEIYVSLDGVTHSTSAPGSFTLVESVPAAGALDLDLVYDIAANPAGVLYALEFEISTDAHDVHHSGAVYVILSPDGPNGMARLHHASLHLEEFLGLAVSAGCNAADVSEAFGTLDINDVLTFAASFNAGAASADLFHDHMFDVNDVLTFAASFNAGCP